MSGTEKVQSIILVSFICSIRSPRVIQLASFGYLGPSSACRTEKAMAPHSSTLDWKIPWTEEPGRLQSMGSRRVGHDWATSLSLFTFTHWRRKWQPTPVFLPGESHWKPGGLLSMGSHRVGHDWRDLAAAAAGLLPQLFTRLPPKKIIGGPAMIDGEIGHSSQVGLLVGNCPFPKAQLT